MEGVDIEGLHRCQQKDSVAGHGQRGLAVYRLRRPNLGLAHADDLLFEVLSRLHEQRPIILTTNKPFAEWNEVFPNSSSVTALVDRLLHCAEIVKIEGDSYRAKEYKERAAQRARQRAAKSRKAKTTRKNAAQA